MSEKSELPIDLEPQELVNALEKGEPVVLVDCREQWEHEIVRLEDSTLIPLSLIPEHADDFESDARVVVYCHHGIRSRYAAALLRQAGVFQARSLRGGIDLWRRQVDPSLANY